MIDAESDRFVNVVSALEGALWLESMHPGRSLMVQHTPCFDRCPRMLPHNFGSKRSLDDRGD